jgi:hypothetical protein
MTIEYAWKVLNYVGAQKEEIAASKALALAVLDEVEGEALQTADIAVNDHFVADTIAPIRSRIAALRGKQ